MHEKPYVEIRELNRAHVLSIMGGMDLHSSPELRISIREAIKKIRVKTLIVNLKEVDYIDSSGLGLLMRLYSEMKNSHHIRFCSSNSLVSEAMRLSGFNRLIEVDEDEHDSIKKLQKILH